MAEIYTPLHLLLFYSGLGLVFVSVFFVGQYWLVGFLAGLALSVTGLVYYFVRAT